MDKFVMIDTAVVRSNQLTPINKTVLAVLVSYSNGKTGVCFPSYATIAEDSGCSRSSAIRSVNKLVELGYISKKVRASSRRNDYTSNIYTLLAVTTSNTKTIAGEVVEESSSYDNRVNENSEQPSVTMTPPSVMMTPPSVTVTPKLKPLNVEPLNPSIYRGAAKNKASDILDRLNEHYNFYKHAHSDTNQAGYSVMLGYIGEMLTDEYTTIARQKVHRDEIARLVFASDTSFLADFLADLNSRKLSFGATEIRKPQSYFKTVFVEAMRSERIIWGNTAVVNLDFQRVKQYDDCFDDLLS